MKKLFLTVAAVAALTSSAFAGDAGCKNIVKVDASEVVVNYTTSDGRPVTLTTSDGRPVKATTSMSGSYCADEG